MFSKSSGPGRNTVPFESHRLAPRTYRIVVGNLVQGEYGFLPPTGMVNKDIRGSGADLRFFGELEPSWTFLSSETIVFQIQTV
jgi:hypothetical protein